jgi:putative membrane protein
VSWHPEAHEAHSAEAHDAEAHAPSGWSQWTADPLVLTTLMLVGAAYTVGTRRLWQRGGRYSGVGIPQLLCMLAGWLAIVLSLLSPLDALSDVSFAAHMTQHEVLMLVAAPLLVLGRPLVVLLWALPGAGRRWVGQQVSRPAFARSWRLLSDPFVTLVVHGLAVWLWHIPVLFDAALAYEPLHAVQHLCFFVSAALFWWALVHGRYGRVGYGVSVLFVFATALHQSVLGALLTLGQVVWYPLAADRARGAGIDPLEDQQLAGLLMWVPTGVLFALLGLALFSAWIGDMEHRARRRSAARPLQ